MKKKIICHNIIQTVREEPWRVPVLPPAQSGVSQDPGQVTPLSAETFILMALMLVTHVKKVNGEEWISFILTGSNF